MKKGFKLIGFYNYTVVLTYIGMIIGLCGVMLVYRQCYVGSLICLMLAGVCDMFDGAIASTKKDRTRDEKSFGIQIDSLSDMICFGVLPAVWVFALSEDSNTVLISIALFTLCGLIRLAYFNVDEANRQQQTQERREYYLGLPITASALALPGVYIVSTYLEVSLCMISPIVLLIVGVCYVVPFKLKKPKLFGEIVIVLVGTVEFCVLVAEALAR